MKYLVMLVLVTSLTGGTLSDAMMKKLQKATPDEPIKALVWMKDQANLRNIKGYKAKEELLKETAQTSQMELIQFLQEKGVEEYKSFWLVNMMYVKATPEVIVSIAKRSDVALVDIVRERHIIQPKKSLKPYPKDGKTVEWNIDKIKADSVWAQYGLTGDGVIVGTMDTGIDPDHPALAGNFSGHFFDAVNGQITPYDDHGHGTHVAGIIAGGDGPGAFQYDIGVAYNAQIVSAKAFDAGGSGEDDDIIACFQWFVSLKVDSGVDIKVVSNSWGSTDETDTTFLPYIRAWREFDIIPVFANGNSGPSSGTAGTPGNFPNVIGVGATNSSDQVASFSSRGPAPSQYPWSDTTLWSRPDWNYIKPDISAPGANIRSSVPGGSYEAWDGTSMATPHVTGVIALMLEMNPSLDYETVYDILTNYGVDHPAGATYPNNDYGWGRLNALLAIENTPTLNSPYLRVLSPVFNDASGNNNGQPDPGETVEMTLPLRNLGLDVLNVTATIETYDSTITILDNTSSYGTVYRDSIVDGDGFSFYADSARRPGLPTNFVISITGQDTSGASYTKVDTITVVIGEPVYYSWFEDDFEGGLSNWILTGTWGTTSSSAHSGNNSLTDSPNGEYPNNSDYYALIKTPFDLSDAYFARLRFWQRYDLESGYDFGHVQAATDTSQGANWVDLFTVTGTQSNWEEVTVNLSSFVGSSRVFIRFLLTSDVSVTEDGWYIDDVNLEKDVPLEGIVLSINDFEVLDQGGNGVLDPGESASLLIALKNFGNETANSVHATLSTSDQYLVINDSTADFGTITANGGIVADTAFQVSALPETPREHHVVLTMNVTDSSGYTKTFQLNLVVGMRTVNDPSGPDNYGYFAYEGNDTSYSAAPTFNWVEIAPEAGGHGTSLSLSDDDDQVVTLPFSFIYYGNTFTNVTIGSNGLMAMGSTDAHDFSNSEIPSSDGPANMIAPLWDDLNPSRGGQIAYYFDSLNHRFIVEWHEVPHYGHTDELETFEVILLDPAYYPTPTGDGVILFQYLTDPTQDDFTTGIENGTQSDGLQIYYDGTTDRYSTGIHGGKVIKFITVSPLDVAEPGVAPMKFRFTISPNPIVRSGKLAFTLPVSANVRIRAYDITGRVVSDLLNRRLQAGAHVVPFDVTHLANGIYFVRIDAGKFKSVKKIIILR